MFKDTCILFNDVVVPATEDFGDVIETYSIAAVNKVLAEGFCEAAKKKKKKKWFGDEIFLNSLWPNDAMWWHKSTSTLA